MSAEDEPPQEKALQLGSSKDGSFEIDAARVATGRTCVMGTSGSGKSYAVGVICEELCRLGVPFAIVDTEGEHGGLMEKYEVLRVGEEDSDIAWEGLDVDDLAKQAPEIAPLILDLSETDDPKGKVSSFLSSLYREISIRRTPYLVIIEEADRFVPQSGEKLQVFGELARRGRKRGIGLMICTQRPSLVDKNVLSQCANQLIGKLVIKNDLQAVSQFFPGNALPKQLTSLAPGQFYALGGFTPEPLLVTVRERTTRHGGATPVLARRVVREYVSAARAVGTRLPAPSGTESGSLPLGLAPLVRPEDVPLWVKKEKRFLVFGKQESILSVQLVDRELLELAVRVRTGILRRKYETKYLTLDGQSGRLVTTEDGIEFGETLGRFLGLGEKPLSVLWGLKTDHDMSLFELSALTGLSAAALRNQVQQLVERRLVRVSALGRTNVYRRMVERPDPSWRSAPLLIEEVSQKPAKVVRSTLKEPEVREVVRTLWDSAELESATVLLYPTYRVELATRNKRRTVYVDGRVGRAVDV